MKWTAKVFCYIAIVDRRNVPCHWSNHRTNSLWAILCAISEGELALHFIECLYSELAVRFTLDIHGRPAAAWRSRFLLWRRGCSCGGLQCAVQVWLGSCQHGKVSRLFGLPSSEGNACRIPQRLAFPEVKNPCLIRWYGVKSIRFTILYFLDFSAFFFMKKSCQEIFEIVFAFTLKFGLCSCFHSIVRLFDRSIDWLFREISPDAVQINQSINRSSMNTMLCFRYRLIDRLVLGSF